MEDIAAVIIENEKLIYKLMSYFPYYQDKDDLYQAGCKGMIEAYNKYDASRDVKFTSYAYSYILGEMRRVVREDKSVKVSRDINRLSNKIERAKSLLSQTLMRDPTIKELSDYLEIPEYYVVEALNSKVSCQSIDSNVGDTKMMLHEIISSPNADIDDLLFLKTELENLGEPERSIMISRYYEDMTQTEIANRLGLSQVDVSRREKKVLTKLRHGLTLNNN